MNAPATDVQVSNALAERGVTRLVHFTAARNLPRILVDQQLRSAADLLSEDFVLHAHTDSGRYDGHPEKISCSIEFPNVHYLKQAQAREITFPDWLYILLDPAIAAQEGSLFAAANAARNDVRLVGGRTGIDACYAARIVTSSRVISRSTTHNEASPTDMQSEVLVPAPIPLSAVLGIVMPSDEAARAERDRMRYLHHDPDVVPWIVSPGMFDVGSVRAAVRDSQRIFEHRYADSEGAQ
jgi:hypothetical protein